MAIEQDRVDVLCGLRGGITLGGPILLAVWNRDFDSWKELMDPWSIAPGRELYIPRPGHADLAGAARFRHTDLRNVLERSSARETAARVTAGGLLRCLLRALGISVHSWVRRIGSVEFTGEYDPAIKDSSSVFCPDPKATLAMERQIDEAIERGDTLGGEFTVVVEGLPAGIGSCTQWDRRLEALLAAQLMSIPGIKAVQAGLGIEAASLPGSRVHDEILPGRPKHRPTNNAGGMEGGMSNGEPLVLTCSMKPIPTLKQGLRSVDIRTGEAVRAGYERSDTCAVPAASVVGEAAVIIAVSQALLMSFSLPNMSLLIEAFESHRAYWMSL